MSLGNIRSRILVGAGIIAFIILNVFVYTRARSSKTNTPRSLAEIIQDSLKPKTSFTELKTTYPTPTPEKILHKVTPTPTPLPIPQGHHEFTIARNNTMGPQLMKGVLDTYDPKIGDKQTLTLTFANEDVTSVSFTLLTDSTKNTYPLTKTGPKTWSGTWTMDALHNYRYQGVIESKNKAGVSTNPISMR